MIRTCNVPGCRGHTTQWGQFCPTHARHARRHGHPEQRAVTKTELRRFERQALARIERNEGNPLWAGVEENWRLVQGHASGIVGEYRGGRAGIHHERIAAEEVLKLGQHVEPRSVIVTALGMFLLQEADPRRFMSDDAFRVQLVRRIRGLAEINAGVWIDAATGKRKLVYRELTPRVARVMADWIIRALGGAGVFVARLERGQREEKKRRAVRMAEGAEALV